MKKLKLNLEKLRTLASAELRSVAGGMRMESDDTCETESAECPDPGTRGHISQSRTLLSVTRYC